MRFGECALHYENHAQIQAAVALRSAKWLSEDTRHETALELGAGTGLFTRHLAKKGFTQLYATDISSEMIAEGRRNEPAAVWSIVDAFTPSWEVPVDRLYSCSLLQWATSPVAVLRSWRALLRPEGRLLVTFFIQGTLSELFPADSALAALKWRSEEQWLDSFRRAGWRVLRSATWQEMQSFPTPVAALRSVHLTGAVRTNRASVADLRRMLLAHKRAHTDRSGGVRLSFRAMQVEAELSHSASSR
jgi:SAM-dependent methyltransferase